MAWWTLLRRELQAAARRKRTYWLRLGTAGLACALCALSARRLGMFPAGAADGRPMFQLLAALGLAYGLLSGPFVTADAISEEKREGTLGLLFLTDLRSFHILAAKFASTALAGFYGLAAIAPALGLPLLLGGVTAGEYARTVLAVLSVTFFSLSGGLAVSSASRDHSKAVLGAAALTLGAGGLIPGLVVLGGQTFGAMTLSKLSKLAFLSPAYAGYLAMESVYRANPAAYWKSVGVGAGLGLAFLAGAAFGVSRAWRAEPRSRSLQKYALLARLRSRRRNRLFRARLERNPVYAAAARLRWPHYVFWSLTLLVALNVFWLTYGYRKNPGSLRFHQNFAYALVFLNRVWIAVMACRFFHEARRTGALELLLTTPVPPRTILRGHWRALRSYFAWPILAIALLHVAYVAAQLFLLQRARGQSVFLSYHFSSYAVMAWCSLANFLTDVLALCLVGTWLSMAVRSPTASALTALSAVIFLPWGMRLLGPGSAVSLLASWIRSWQALPLLGSVFGDWGNAYALARSFLWIGKNLFLALIACRLLRSAWERRERLGWRGG